MLTDLMKLVISDLYKKKFSSFLTLFAISLGVLTIFLIFLLSSGFSSSLDAEFDKLGTNRLYVSSKVTGLSGSSSKSLTDNLLKQVQNRPYVKDIFPYVMQTVQLKSGTQFISKMVIGTHLSQTFFDANSGKISQGRFPKLSEKYSIVLGSNAGEELFDKDLRVGSNLFIDGVKFKVVGILESFGNPEDDKNVFVNIDTIRNIFDLGDSIALFDVVVDPGYDVTLAQNNLQIFLDNRVGDDVLDVRSLQDMMESLDFVLDIIKYTLGGIGVIALLVGALGIVNTMYVVVSDRQKEIGIMKAIGARDFDILFMFVFQAGMYGFFGGVLGIIMAAGVSVLFEVVAQAGGFTFLKITFDFVAAFWLIIFSFIIGIISGYVPSKQAADLVLVDAIRK
ncbi:MAG: ABC transporter permease [Nanoarchaeales archaeon]|nr:ABC transporter permease [Nanoarchaeales archaeon]